MFNPTLRASNLKEFNLDKYEELVPKLASINKDNLETELMELPSYFSYYHGLMIRAKKEFDYNTILLETLKAELGSSERKSGKRTVADMTDYLNSHSSVKELNKILLESEEIYELMKSICLTLGHKKDMLVQLSANRREEAKLYK